MARAKHRDTIAQREFESFVRKTDRAFAHQEVLKGHKEHARNERRKAKAS